MAEDLSQQGSTPARRRGAPPRLWQAPDPLVRFLSTGWPLLWVFVLAVGHAHWALLMLLLTGPLVALARGPRSSVRRQLRRDRHRAERRELYDRRVLEREQRRQGHEDVATGAHQGSWGGRYPGSWVVAGSWADREPAVRPQGPATAPPSGEEPPAHDPAAAERSLVASLARARSGPSPLDPDALALVDELAATLRPMLERAREGGVDATVRRDLESIALEHLPGALRAYQQLPVGYAHEHRAADGRTGAEELRSQLSLLLEGCAPLRDAVHGADVARQRELGRFLEAKFRRSDLDL